MSRRTNFLGGFVAAAVSAIFILTIVAAVTYQGPRSSQQEIAIAIGDSISTNATIRGAGQIGLFVPTITADALILNVGYDTDSTFAQMVKESAAGDTLLAWTLHNGTGLFGVDITKWVGGFDFFNVETSSAQAEVRTFHVTVKY